MKKDTIYAQKLAAVKDFKFDKKVANVFPDMIQRSIPGYNTLISNIGIIANKYSKENSNIYDLGCSTGAVTQSICHRTKKAGCTIHAVDNSVEMLEKAKITLANEDYPIPVKFHHEDVCDLLIENASVVVMNFTLQFITPSKRQPLIKYIYENLIPGGILIISEKVLMHNEIHELVDNLHLEFKRDQGYSELEISQKRTSLENVMLLDPFDTHISRLQDIGFKNAHSWFNCFNFYSFLAIK